MDVPRKPLTVDMEIKVTQTGILALFALFGAWKLRMSSSQVVALKCLLDASRESTLLNKPFASLQMTSLIKIRLG